METKITYTLSFKIDDRPYNFNVVAGSRKEALGKLYDDIATLVKLVNYEFDHDKET